MPVTARLSKLFYDRLGEQVANELVDRACPELRLAQRGSEGFNQVDATYRGDLRELNELNFARFDAKLEQRLAVFEATIERRFATLETKVNERFATLDAKIDRVAAELRETLERRLGKQTRWFFVAWASLLVPVLGLWFRS